MPTEFLSIAQILACLTAHAMHLTDELARKQEKEPLLSIATRVIPRMSVPTSVPRHEL
jgi:hypothetical protein